MSTERLELFASLLALVALGGCIVYASVLRWKPNELVQEVRKLGLWLAWLVATVAMVGSLYFSEIAHFAPCQLCWYQRISMYSLAGVLFVAALRRDRSAKWYCLPMLIAGTGVSAYHYFIEWKPAFGENMCSVGPACTDIWFRRMGFVTLAFMALCGFMAIFILLFVEPKVSRERQD